MKSWLGSLEPYQNIGLCLLFGLVVMVAIIIIVEVMGRRNERKERRLRGLE